MIYAHTELGVSLWPLMTLLCAETMSEECIEYKPTAM